MQDTNLNKHIDQGVIFAEGAAASSDSWFAGGAGVGKFSFINRCTVGRYFGLGCFSYISDSRVGSYCTFGSRVSIGAFSHPSTWLSIHEFQYRDTLKIYGEAISERESSASRKITRIGSDVWIGDNAVVLAGLEIGDGVIVGAGSVVTKSVTDFSIVVGNPARVLRSRFDSTIIQKLKKLRWWELPMSMLDGVPFSDINASIAELERRLTR